ncbi:phage head closure protein [Metabacillus halosaccharovorans]|uniref:phage head closure protein n=1 Tax=Metabacillus halosaccharovorans TaxID=930124 RepID=UPI001473D939|nr:phage head closure protein [Metabacillus halosaccharovorans]
MRHKDVIFLLSITITVDEIGNQIEQSQEREVFANEFDISTTEYYQAGALGLKPEKKFEVYNFEYNGETKFKYNNDIYDIIRTQTKGEKIRLTGAIKNG